MGLIEYQRNNVIKKERIFEKNKHNLIHIDSKLAQKYGDHQLNNIETDANTIEPRINH